MILDFFFPRFCASCGRRLAQTELHLCCECLRELPRTNYHLTSPSPLEQMFWGHFPVERATALFFYTGVNTRNILYRLKYHNSPDVGRYVAHVMADEIGGCGFFDGVDVVVPVPLAFGKKLRRGYNQCEWIAKGIGDATGLPVVSNAVRRIRNNPSQTGLNAIERWENVDGIFRLVRPDAVRGKHVLLIDDVVTTGATTVACAQSIAAAGGDVRISVVALAMAGERRLNEPLSPL